MPIIVKLFGELVEKVGKQKDTGGAPLILNIEKEGIKTVSDILEKLSLKREITSHLFVNGIFSGFGKNVRDGDRIAIFPKRMGLLYKWYFNKVEND